ncbi:hypothetical protein JKP88DRAFT_168390, partial [Tribonema minus]
TLRDVVNLFSEQGGACFYSGIPLTAKGNWKVSFERRNVRIKYTRDNCCLIGVEFQGCDQTACSLLEGTGCGGWSHEKYLFFRANYNPANAPATLSSDSCWHGVQCEYAQNMTSWYVPSSSSCNHVNT